MSTIEKDKHLTNTQQTNKSKRYYSFSSSPRNIFWFDETTDSLSRALLFFSNKAIACSTSVERASRASLARVA